MLVLTRQVDEDICIGPDIRVRVLSISSGQVRLGIDAPKHVPIYRGELLEAIQNENRAASQQPDAAVQSLRSIADVADPQSECPGAQ